MQQRCQWKGRGNPTGGVGRYPHGRLHYSIRPLTLCWTCSEGWRSCHGEEEAKKLLVPNKLQGVPIGSWVQFQLLVLTYKWDLKKAGCQIGTLKENRNLWGHLINHSINVHFHSLNCLCLNLFPHQSVCSISTFPICMILSIIWGLWQVPWWMFLLSKKLRWWWV